MLKYLYYISTILRSHLSGNKFSLFKFTISKFKQIDRDPTLTQLSTLQKYLRTLYNRGELTEEQF